VVSPSQATAKLGWRELCQDAIREEDPKKSVALIAELSCILEEEESRLVRLSVTHRPSRFSLLSALIRKSLAYGQ